MLALFLLAVCHTAGVVAGACLSRQRVTPVSQRGLIYEANAASGDISGKTKGQRRRKPSNIVEEGMLAMSTDVTLFGKTTGANHFISWTIGNPPSQGELIRVEIIRDDAGEKIFEIGAIRSGNYLESGSLLAPLPAGEYDCTTVFLAYQEETEALMGQAAVKIKLVLRE